MDSLFFQDTAENIDPWSAVVIAADHHDPSPGNGSRQTGDEMVKQLHRLGGGNGLVVDISSDDNGLRLLLSDIVHDLPKNILLIFPKIPVHQL